MSRAPLIGLVAAALGLGAVKADAGPWAAGQGRLYAKLAVGRLTSTRLAFPDGTVFDIPEFRKDDADLYVFYGVSGRVSVLAGLPLRSSDLDDDPDELRRETGIGDIEGGLQLQLGTRGPCIRRSIVERRRAVATASRRSSLRRTGRRAGPACRKLPARAVRRE